MPRSLKKGPFVDDHLAREGRAHERGRRPQGHQDVVAPLARSPPTWSVTRSRCTTAASTCRCTSPRRWSVTSSASSRPRARSGTTPGKSDRAGADGQSPRRPARASRADRPLPAGLAVQDPPGARPRARPAGRRRERLLQLCEKDAADNVLKLLDSAIANAEHNQQLPVDELFVARCWCDEGPTRKSGQARARGRYFRVRKRTSHVTIVLARYDADELEARRRRDEASGRGAAVAQRRRCRACAPFACSAEPRRRRARSRSRPRGHDHEHDRRRRRGRRDDAAIDETRRRPTQPRPSRSRRPTRSDRVGTDDDRSRRRRKPSEE